MNAAGFNTINSDAVDAVARAICRESCAVYGEPPCWSIGPWPNDECIEPGCVALAEAALDAIPKAEPA